MLARLMKKLHRQFRPGSEADWRAAGDLRLHIGGRHTHPDWKILDVLPGAHVDYVGSCTDLSAFADESVTEMYASHVLEHLGYIDELPAALKEFNRVLRRGGVLRVSVPDLTVLCKLFLDSSLSDEERFHVMRMMFGGQMDAADFHRVGFNQEMLGAYLVQAGFVDIVRLDRFGLFDDASDLVFKGHAISVNMRCRRADL